MCKTNEIFITKNKKMSNLKRLFIVFFIAGINCYTDEKLHKFKRNVNNCVEASFVVKNIQLDSSNDLEQNKISFLTSINIKDSVDIPSAFMNKQEYQSTCLEAVTYEIYRPESPNIIDYSVERTSNGLVMFENLRYTQEYEVKTSYKQKGSNKKINVETIKKTTCYGEPDVVTNIEAKLQNDKSLVISWRKPRIPNAPKVCYYEVTVKEIDSSNFILWSHFFC